MPTQPPSVYTVARELLTKNSALTNDAAVPKVKALGVTLPEAEIRRVLTNTRSDLRKRKSVVARAKALSPYTLTREFLTADPSLTTDTLVAKIKARGVTKSDADIRDAIRRTRSDMHTNAPKPAPAAAHATTEPKAPAPTEAGPTDERALFAAIGLVNKTAQLCGGVTKARAIADAIRACGGIDAFLRRLDLVAEILGSETEL